MKRLSIKTKLVLVLVGLFAAAMVVDIYRAETMLRRQMEDDLEERGSVIALQMHQIWNYLVQAQDDGGTAMAYTGYMVMQEDNCAVAGREISVTFTDASSYVTRYVRTDPRNPGDTPDEYETRALEAFAADAGAASYSSITSYDGRLVYRYLEPMRITEICLDCHGGPAGEVDITGYAKEGFELGDLAGAVSVVVPMDSFQKTQRAGVVNNVVSFSVMLAIVLVVIYLALTRLVTRPLTTVQDGFVRAGSGDLDVRLPEDLHSREMNDLARNFNVSADNLREAYRNLEGMVETRTEQLKSANTVLEEQRRALEEVNELLRTENQYKTDFLSIVSHELRTPLTSILAFAELLKDDESLDEEGQTACREIESNSRALMLLINDILETNRLDAGRMQLSIEAVDVFELIGFVEQVVAPIAARAGVELASEAEGQVPIIRGDFDKLVHALQNLVFNAVKFTPEGGRVEVRAWAPPGEGVVRIAVSDTGIGIAEEDRERIFERFVQADSALNRRYSGTGLGLPLAREIAELHGGRIELESEPGAGSVFTLVLPVAEE